MRFNVNIALASPDNTLGSLPVPETRDMAARDSGESTKYGARYGRAILQIYLRYSCRRIIRLLNLLHRDDETQ